MYVYLMGRGHSGSTILDILLGGGKAVESVGELVSGLENYHRAERCSCGALMRECGFWGNVRAAFERQGFSWDEMIEASHAATDVRRWLATRLAAPDDPWRNRLATLTRALAAAVAEVSGKPHVLDSNKETARGLFLLRFMPEARVIHLVRDPRGIVRSHYWRVRDGKGFLFMRRRFAAGKAVAPLFLILSAISWTVGNSLCELSRRIGGRRILQLRYEDLRDQPVTAVRRIGTTFGLPVADVIEMIEQGEAFPVGHNVGGNHIRREGAVRFDPQAEHLRPPLPRWAELVTIALCWPLMRRYGYLASGRGDAAPSGTPRTQAAA
jgi:hypothetical protein